MYNGSYLRVLTPRTTNGSNPVIVDGRQQYREAHLPLAARHHLEKLNRSTPQHLRKIIEVVDGYADKQIKNEQEGLIQQLQAELAALKAAQTQVGSTDQASAQTMPPMAQTQPAVIQQQTETALPKAQIKPAGKPTLPATPNVQPQNQ
jgi:hypothetical protein